MNDKDIIVVDGKRYKVVKKFRNSEADMLEIEPLTEIDLLTERVSKLEHKLDKLTSILKPLNENIDILKEIISDRRVDLIASGKLKRTL